MKEQIDCFEEIIRRFSKIKVKRFLDVACGSSLQLREIAKRGYEAIGLDSSPEMLAYLQEKAKEGCLKIEEFKMIIRLNREFEFLGWWEGSENRWFLDRPLEKAEKPGNINTVLLRRK